MFLDFVEKIAYLNEQKYCRILRLRPIRIVKKTKVKSVTHKMHLPSWSTTIVRIITEENNYKS